MSPVTPHAIVIVIERRFHGPPQSGHAGCTCGLLARELQGTVQVSLRSPPPLERHSGSSATTCACCCGTAT